jgi:hypothetical protein
VLNTTLRPFIMATNTPQERGKWIDYIRERVIATILPGMVMTLGDEEDKDTEELRNALRSVLPDPSKVVSVSTTTTTTITEANLPSSPPTFTRAESGLSKSTLSIPPLSISVTSGKSSGNASPSGSPRKREILQEGLLYKGSGKDRRKPGGWQKRWFVLKPSGITYGVSKVLLSSPSLFMFFPFLHFSFFLLTSLSLQVRFQRIDSNRIHQRTSIGRSIKDKETLHLHIDYTISHLLPLR